MGGRRRYRVFGVVWCGRLAVVVGSLIDPFIPPLDSNTVYVLDPKKGKVESTWAYDFAFNSSHPGTADFATQEHVYSDMGECGAVCVRPCASCVQLSLLKCPAWLDARKRLIVGFPFRRGPYS